LRALADAKQVSLQSGDSVYAASLSDGVNCMPVSYASTALASGALDPGSIVRVTDYVFTGSGANKCADLLRAPPQARVRSRLKRAHSRRHVKVTAVKIVGFVAQQIGKPRSVTPLQ